MEVSRKTLERNRKFIIAVALIYNGPYPYLRDYLHIKEELEEEGGPRMNKGIVMDITGKSIIVMRPDGKFERVPRKKRTCEIGEEIVYAEAGIHWRSPSVAAKSALAAARRVLHCALCQF
ncbi:anti-sigma factor domain-containing protein [Paenibacillus sp. P26]|nr:anti-sigma factor domain-containing protein [Paenibacillus sp. P26]